MPSFTPDYSRQIRLRGFGERGQAALTQSRVLVIGAGGLGCNLIPQLAGAGVGTITIIDHDRLEASNLHRQTLYKAGQIGRLKAELAAAAAMDINPGIEARALTRKLHAEELLVQIKDQDLVLECTDDFSNKLLVNDAAVLLRKPAVFASAVQREGQVQTYTGEPDSACLRCLWSQVPTHTLSCEDTGVLGSVPACIGNIQATEAVQWLVHNESPNDGFLYQSLKNRVFYFDAATYQQRILELKTSRTCSTHAADYSREKYLSTHENLEYSGSFAEAQAAGFEIIDIRDPETARANPLPAECTIRSRQELLNEDPVDKPLLLVCYQGRTSASLAAQLRQRGNLSAYSKSGGANSL